MPLDHYEDDDENKELAPSGRFDEYECPTCNANNPVDPPFGDGDEVLCNYCGSEFLARVSDEGRLKLKER